MNRMGALLLTLSKIEIEVMVVGELLSQDSSICNYKICLIENIISIRVIVAICIILGQGMSHRDSRYRFLEDLHPALLKITKELKHYINRK